MFRWTKKTWVVVADGEKAIILRNDSASLEPQLLVVSKERQPDPANRIQNSDRAGRRSDGGPGQKSAMEETDWHDLAKGQFARDLTDQLQNHARKNAFDRLVLVASPQVLGAMRGEMNAELTDRIVAEVPKTLTNHPVPEIEKRLNAELEKL